MNLNDQLAQLLGRLQDVAPTVWQAAERQVIINARIDLVWAALCFIVTGWLTMLVVRGVRASENPAPAHYEQSDAAGGAILCSVLAIFAFATGLYLLTAYIKVILNPTWAAIQLILAQFGGK